MNTEKNNFHRVIDWLRANGYIHNQKDLAQRIGTTETTITRNKKGNVRRFDEETIIKFNEVFGDIINIAYLRGESSIMLVSNLLSQERINRRVNQNPKFTTDITADTNAPDSPTTGSLINSALAAKDETIEAMKREISAKDELIATLRAQLADKDNVIADKERYISSLQRQYPSGCL